MAEEHQQPLSRCTTDDTCPWCGHEFEELYMRFDRDTTEFQCSHCNRRVSGYRDVTFFLHPIYEK